MSFSHNLVSRSLHFWLLIFLIFLVLHVKSQKDSLQVKVGVVIDTNAAIGNLSLRAINLSLSEFYNTHNGFKTRIVLNVRSSKQTIVGAAASAFYLINKRKVTAIIGPGNSMQAPFLINLGNQTQVPIVSFSATSPLLDSLRSPYFIRATHDDSSQVQAISAIVDSFGWREVVTIYVDNVFGEGILPYLVDAFQEINVRIKYRSAISLYSTDDQITKELYKLMSMPTRVFIVHMLPDIGSRVFSIAKDIGMMSEGYAWIVTNAIADLMSLLDESNLEDMHGVLGVKTYCPRSKELAYLEARWRKRFGGEELHNFGYWAYDAATALAMSIEEISKLNVSFDQIKNISRDDIETDLDDLGVTLSGPKLIEMLSRISFKGVSGRFQLKRGKLEPTTFKIINIEEDGERTVGFWRSKIGLVKSMRVNQIGNNISHGSNRLRSILWPGDTALVPKGWEIPINSKKLRIAVPKKNGFNNFVKVTKDANTNALTITGFCIDVFDTVMRQMPYPVAYEYIPFEAHDGESSGSYDKMVYKVSLGEFDGAVGDTTILFNRSIYVDFALPYSETGIVFVVPVTDKREKGAWVFLKPLSGKLWFLTAGFFVYIGMVVWFFEHQTDPNQGIFSKLSDVYYFSFSTLFFAHRKPSESVFTRALVVIWCFLLLILTQSYTATLTSMMTIQELEPTVRHMDDLRKSGVNIGYQTGSFTLERLKQLNFAESRLKTYTSPQEMRELFLNTTSNGGIDAAFDEVPYIKLFMNKYCSEYTIIEPKYKADGFGFAFPLGSPLVSDISRQILNVTEGETMKAIEKKWLDGDKNCPESTKSDSPIQLDHHQFKALFLIVFVVSELLLLIKLVLLVYDKYKENKLIQNRAAPDPPGDGPDAQQVHGAAALDNGQDQGAAALNEGQANAPDIEHGNVRDQDGPPLPQPPLVQPHLVRQQSQPPTDSVRYRKYPSSKNIVPLPRETQQRSRIKST